MHNSLVSSLVGGAAAPKIPRCPMSQFKQSSTLPPNTTVPGEQGALLARRITSPPETPCACDFCSGRKKYSDNWRAYCAVVKMTPPKWWENLDLCDACEKLHHEDPERFWAKESHA